MKYLILAMSLFLISCKGGEVHNDVQNNNYNTNTNDNSNGFSAVPNADDCVVPSDCIATN